MSKKPKSISAASASVTIYLSITFSLLLSLLVYTIESCHLSSLIAHGEGISYMSLDSLFGQYCLPLFEKYGLFCLNEQGLDLAEDLKKYAENNCAVPYSLLKSNHSFLKMSVDSVDITDTTYITDNDGEIFVQQVCDYIKYLELSEAVDNLLDDCDTDYPNLYSSDDSGTPDISFDSIDLSKLDAYVPDDSDDTGETSIDISDIDAKTFEDSISESIGHIIKTGLLSFLVDNPETVSTLSIDKAVMPSVTCQLTEDGIEASYGYFENMGDATYKKACFCEYITNTFSCYTDTPKDNALNYQMEYVVYGSDKDDVNLINCCLQLITMRTGLNLVHLFSDRDKYNAAMKIAKKAQSLPIPGAVFIVQMSILTIWATAEAIIDVRDLLQAFLFCKGILYPPTH